MRDDASRRQIPLVPQMARNDCGPACLAMSLGYHGRYTELEEVLELTEVRRLGTDALSLLETARHLGLDGEGIRLDDIEDLECLEPGSILHWRSRHYVVLESYRGGKARIVDPACGRRNVNGKELRRSFAGIALTLTPSESFQPRESKAPSLPWRQILRMRARCWIHQLIQNSPVFIRR